MSEPDPGWRDIPDWPHEAHEDGRIRRKPWRDADGCLHLGGELAQCPDKRKGKDYLYATLRDGQRRRKAHVAVLVLEAHRGLKPGPGYEACHGNGVRTDNRLSNLRWDTKAANLAQMWEQRRIRAMTDNTAGLSPGGLQCHCAQVRGGAAASARLSPASVTSDRPHGTGSWPVPHMSPSQFTLVQPRSRSVRSFLSPRSSRPAA